MATKKSSFIEDLNFLHTQTNWGFLIILIALIVFSTALVGSLTGSSVYYQYKQFPVYHDPTVIKQPVGSQSVQFDALKGEGNAYICVTPQGNLYRNENPCR